MIDELKELKKYFRPGYDYTGDEVLSIIEIFNSKKRAVQPRAQADYHTDTYKQLEDFVCSYFNITATQLKSRKRDRELVDARYIIAALMRVEMGYSVAQVARMIGIHHSTVIHGIKYTQNGNHLASEFKKIYNLYNDTQQTESQQHRGGV